MPTWMLVNLPVVAWVGDTDSLTREAIEVMAAWQFAWHDDRNLVMLVDDDA